LLVMKLHLFIFTYNLFFSSTSKTLLMCSIWSILLWLNTRILLNHNEFIYERSQNLIHHPHECARCIC
jgi:hypothetical protein